MTTDEIRDLLVTLLTGVAGGTTERWTDLIGPVESFSIMKNIQSNWRVSPIATGTELRAIINAVELVRIEHPYADWKPA